LFSARTAVAKTITKIADSGANFRPTTFAKRRQRLSSSGPATLHRRLGLVIISANALNPIYWPHHT
jgi:hypothetical protein